VAEKSLHDNFAQFAKIELSNKVQRLPHCDSRRAAFRFAFPLPSRPEIRQILHSKEFADKISGINILQPPPCRK
jgi:hypothetical protein